MNTIIISATTIFFLIYAMLSYAIIYIYKKYENPLEEVHNKKIKEIYFIVSSAIWALIFILLFFLIN